MHEKIAMSLKSQSDLGTVHLHAVVGVKVKGGSVASQGHVNTGRFLFSQQESAMVTN